MNVHLHWFLPTGGDGRTLVDRHAYTDGGIKRDRITPVSGVRAPDIEYLAQIAKAAEQLGFEAVLTPTGTWCEDAWLTTVALAQHTERLKFLVAFRPGVISPVLAAQMAATYQRITRGRLLLNVVTGGDSTEQRRFGDHLDHDRRYARTAEFLSVVRGAWSGRPFDFDGEHYQVEGGLTALPPDPLPEIFFGGSSAAAGPVAAAHADVYLTWGEPPADVKKKIDWIRGLAEEQGRTVRFGIRLHTISRDSSREAWATADRLLGDLDADTVAAAQQALGRSESVGQQRMLALHGGRATNWRSRPTCGPVSAWYGAAPAPRWSAATPRSRTGSRSTTRWGWSTSCSPDTRIWRRRTGSVRASLRSWRPGGCCRRSRRPRSRRSPRRTAVRPPLRVVRRC